MTPKDRKLALALAVETLEAQRDPEDATRWVYFADETDSWWSVTEASLLAYAETYDRLGCDALAAYDEWAENDSTAVDRGGQLRRGAR